MEKNKNTLAGGFKTICSNDTQGRVLWKCCGKSMLTFHKVNGQFCYFIDVLFCLYWYYTWGNFCCSCFSDSDENGNGPVAQASSSSAESSSGSETDSEDDTDSDSLTAQKKKSDMKSKPKVTLWFRWVFWTWDEQMFELSSRTKSNFENAQQCELLCTTLAWYIVLYCILTFI